MFVWFASGRLIRDRFCSIYDFGHPWRGHTITGWGLCPEHRQLHEQGFVALVECDPEKSGNPGVGAKISPSRVYRTGKLAHLKREAFVDIFNVAAEPNTPCVFVDPGVIAMLEKIQSRSE